MIKKIVSVLILGLGFLLAQGQSWQLIWADEFNGNSINSSNWTHEIGTGFNGWGNNELQSYTNSTNNSQVSSGSLKIHALQQNIGQSNYSSARIISKNKFSFQYGKIEARIKMPLGQGLWPAFWMLGQNIDAVNWPQCGEIDIVEHINNSPEINGTMHWDAGGHAYWGGSAVCDASQFHTYSVIWDNTTIRWYLDDIEYHSANITDNVNSTEEFHQSFFLIMNIAVGGNWPGSPNASTFFPATMEIDYIRVYQETAALNNVTFQVDMSNVTSNFSVPEVNGTFNNWCGNCAPMSDPDGDNIWEVTIPLNTGSYEYKYSFDNWTEQENLLAGSSCTTTNFGYTNRTIYVGQDMVLPAVCYGSCTNCQETILPVDITFQLDMNDFTGTYATPEVNGTFNNWCGNCNPMTDANGDEIWETTLSLLPGNYEYKFSTDNWTNAETLIPGSSCTLTNGTFTNRLINLTSSIAIDTVCWQSCNACPPNISVLENSNETSVFPNPATGQSVEIFSTPSPKQLELINSSGQIVLRQIITGEINRINISTFPKGVYCIRISNATSIETKTLIIQ
ncbi:MAG: family 16 glycosylhydrolase [Bacteroidota bacterium]